MKIHKKIGIGLSLLLVLLIGVFFHNQKAYAATMKPSDFANYKYVVSGFDTSNGKIDTLILTIEGKDYYFVDKNTGDNTNRLEFLAKKATGPVCGMEQGQGGDMFGITYTPSPVLDGNGKAHFAGQIGVGYSGDTAVDCNENGAQEVLKPPVDIKIAYSLSQPGAPVVAPSSPDDLASPPAHYWVNPKDLSVINATIDNNPYTFNKGSGWVYKPSSGEFCAGSTGITTGDMSNIQAGMNEIGTVNVNLPKNSSCSNATNATKQVNIDVTTDPNGTPVNANPTPPGGSTTPTCESNLNSSFDWIICPTLRGLDGFTGMLNKFVNDQLCVNTGTSSTAGGETFKNRNPCSGSANIYGEQTGKPNGVKTAWSSFKNIATALLVILMLVMVISQAIGGGPFDAYTVRKVLPKIVAAVILIQLSWVITKFAIDLTNDLGKGIQDLLFTPFGGEGNMALDKLIGYNFSGWSNGANDGLFLAAIAGGVLGALALSWAGLGLMGLYMVLALLTAFIVLILRKLILILLIILAPVAFILWILPGTEKYWKSWQDNFTKLLLMFPIIMGLIAAGRIFAYITSCSNGNCGYKTALATPHLAFAHIGSLPVPYMASFTDFIGLFIIIGAYFGPYFLLPKAFQWGGTAMKLAGKGVQAGVERAGKPAKGYLTWRQGLSPWKQARAARRAEVERRAKLGFVRRLGAEGFRGRYRRARLAGPEALIPGLRGRDRAIREAVTRAGEARLREEEIKEQTLQLANETDPVTGLRYSEMAREDKLRYLEAHAIDPATNEFRRQVLLQQLGMLRGGDELLRVRDNLLQSGRGEQWNRAVSTYFDDFNSTSPVLTNQATAAMLAHVDLHTGRVTGRTFTAAEDMDWMAGQNDQTIATQSSSGWRIYEQQATAAGLRGQAEATYRRIMTSGQPYAGSVNPVGHRIFGGGPPAPAVAPGPGAVTPAPSAPTGSRSEAIIGMSDSDIHREVRRIGGWAALSNPDLLRIYNYRTGSVKDQAETELRNRRLLS